MMLYIVAAWIWVVIRVKPIYACEYFSSHMMQSTSYIYWLGN